MSEFTKAATFLKADESLGLIFGFAVVCKHDGADFFDSQGDNIPEDSMLEAATDFMVSSRAACDMHKRDENGEVIADGSVVFAFPLTTDIAKALGIETTKTGLLVALKPDNPETLQKALNGDYTGFSIGGAHIEVEEVDE